VYIYAVNAAGQGPKIFGELPMLMILQVVTVFLVSIAWAQALAHVLELPGKMRLGKDAYISVQTIYYPGFTIGGALGEGLGMCATLALLVVTEPTGPAFAWTLSAFLALIAMHATYWIVTHPVNKFWLKDHNLKGLGAGFFGLGERPRDIAESAESDDVWARLRDRWEYSHVTRAAFAGAALLSLIIALAI
jgi:hypothetical protein